MRRRGFTLLEMLVATAIMGFAVVGLLSNLSTSLRTASRLTEYDRAVVLARGKLDELLLDRRMPRQTRLEGTFDRSLTGDTEMGWRATLNAFEIPPDAIPSTSILERIDLEVWWGSGERKRTVTVDGYRRAKLVPPELAVPTP
ncbi:MAG TPA: type II secretion system protein [Bryobacteraceae bacterium]|nr:type II secretion system protein [Bryobacteraceae bacterium]